MRTFIDQDAPGNEGKGGQVGLRRQTPSPRRLHLSFRDRTGALGAPRAQPEPRPEWPLRAHVLFQPALATRGGDWGSRRAQ